MSVQTAIRLDSEMLEKLKDLSKDGRPMSWHIRKALTMYLEGQAKLKPFEVPATVSNSGFAVAKEKKAANYRAYEHEEVKPLSVASGLSADAGVVIDYLNQIAGTKYRDSDSSRKDIVARLNQGFSVQDCKTVINKKCAEWLGTDMAKYLRPQTLFNASKFDGYLNQLVTQNQTQRNAQEVDDWVSGSTKSVFGEVFEHE